MEKTVGNEDYTMVTLNPNPKLEEAENMAGRRQCSMRLHAAPFASPQAGRRPDQAKAQCLGV